MLTSAELLAQPSSRLPIACLSVKLLMAPHASGNATTDTNIFSIFLVRLCRFLTSLTRLPQQSDFHLSVHFPFHRIIQDGYFSVELSIIKSSTIYLLFALSVSLRPPLSGCMLLSGQGNRSTARHAMLGQYQPIDMLRGRLRMSFESYMHGDRR
jgi:hypothetical protein